MSFSISSLVSPLAATTTFIGASSSTSNRPDFTNVGNLLGDAGQALSTLYNLRGTARDTLGQLRGAVDAKSILNLSRIAAARLLFSSEFRRPSIEEMREDGLIFHASASFRNLALSSLAKGEPQFWNHLSLSQTATSVLGAQMRAIQYVGPEQYARDYQTVNSSDLRFPVRRFPVHEKFAKVGHQLFVDWAIKSARLSRASVYCDNASLVPDEGHVIYAHEHKTTGPDFWFPMLDPYSLPVGDAYNFRNNRLAKQSAFAQLFDYMGLGLVNRVDADAEVKSIVAAFPEVAGDVQVMAALATFLETEPDALTEISEAQLRKYSDKMLMDHLVDTSILTKLRPEWYIQGGRLPEAFDEMGTTDRAGFFSNVLDPKNPRKYIQAEGAVSNAMALAAKVKEPVSLIVSATFGTEFLMPKRSLSFPFIQENYPDRDLMWRHLERIVVEPISVGKAGKTERRRVLIRLGRDIPQIMREGVQIEGLLQDKVGEWLEHPKYNRDGRYSRQRVRQNFASQKKDDFYMLVDRTRSIHPFHRRKDYDAVIAKQFRKDYIAMITQEIRAMYPSDAKKYEDALAEALADAKKYKDALAEKIAKEGEYFISRAQAIDGELSALDKGLSERDPAVKALLEKVSKTVHTLQYAPRPNIWLPAVD